MKFCIKALLPFILFALYIYLCFNINMFLAYFIIGIIAEVIILFNLGKEIHENITWSFVKELLFWPYYSVILQLSDSFKYIKYKIIN